MILIMGADGLLGSWLCYLHQKNTIGFTRRELDVRDEYHVLHTLKQYRPDAVVNCAGITNKRNVDPETRTGVNAIAPHLLARACDVVGAKLVHLSTDCAFKGRYGGAYVESDEPDAEDNYGWTKAQGEISRPPHLTVRCSFVGWPDPKYRNLLAWLELSGCVESSSYHRSVPGYANVLWNGLTVVSVCDYLMELAYGRQFGTMHLYGQTISKYTLLETVQAVYGWKRPTLYRQDYPVKDITLASTRSDRPTLLGTTNFEEQVRRMKDHEKGYRAWLKEQKIPL